jgi:GTP pyrophosphokinase
MPDKTDNPDKRALGPESPSRGQEGSFAPKNGSLKDNSQANLSRAPFSVSLPVLEEWLGETPTDGREKPVDLYVPLPANPRYTPKAININNIIDIYRDYYPDAPSETDELIRQAYTDAAREHKGDVRLSGEAYLSHPLAVAHILANLKLDAVTIAAGLLHDTVEDTSFTLDDIEEGYGENYGPVLRFIVDGVTKIDKSQCKSKTERKAANLNKILLASMKDIRVLLVKLADRLHNMRSLSFMKEDKRVEISRETLDYYAPLATRLGIHKMKAELEDLSLFYLHPKEYTDVTKKLSTGRKEREEYVSRVKKLILKRLDEFGIKAEVDGRDKHIYSIWRKMRNQNIPLERIYDLFAFRIIVNSVENCYKVLGVVHTFFKPLPGRFKDYISLPKPNGYRSLHTAAVGPDNIPIEIQIRTLEMHGYSEDGVAAHWRYKEGGRISLEEEELIFKLRETLAKTFGIDKEKPDEYLNNLKEFLKIHESPRRFPGFDIFWKQYYKKIFL